MSTVTFGCDLGGGVTYPIYVGDVLSKIDEYVSQIYEGDKVIIVIDELMD